MTYIPFTDFRNNAKVYFDAIEKNEESFIIIRKGVPIAEVNPFQKKKKNILHVSKK